MGETITMMFIRAFEQGETVYMSMVCCGYSENTRIYRAKSNLDYKDLTFVSITVAMIISLQYLNMFVL